MDQIIFIILQTYKLQTDTYVNMFNIDNELYNLFSLLPLLTFYVEIIKGTETKSRGKQNSVMH